MDIIETMEVLLFLLFYQQRVDYRIFCSLDDVRRELKISEKLVYYNNAPVSLETLYFHLYANAYRDNNTTFAKELKRLGSYRFLKAKKSERGWIDINSVKKGDKVLNFITDETIMAVVLDRPLLPGDSIVLMIDAVLKIPKIFSRLGYKGRHYEIVQWYPKPCVFDKKGWHKQGYHAIGEFYGEFGNFDVSIELPADYVIAGSGVIIDSARIENNRKVVRFIAENVHDFAWVCDPNFEIEKREVDGIDIEIYYLKKQKRKWQNAGEYAVDALKRYNNWFGKYPYKKLSVVQGYFDGGMEYPNLVIIGGREDNLTKQFEMVIIHEIAHQWFYGIIGSNEMDEAWLDEGFTSYAEARYFVDKYGIENSFFKSSFLPELRHNYINRLMYYITLTNQIERPILTKSYEFIDSPIAYQTAAYSKPSLFLRYLEAYLGSNTFDTILKRYFNDFKFKHPESQDFIRICEEVSGKDLKQFFYDLLHTTKYCDWHVKKISKNSLVVENKGKFLLPTDVFILTDNGGQVLKIERELDTFVIADAKKIKKVIIDPYDYTPEANRYNNFYPRKFAIKPFFNWPSFDTYQIFILPYLWYNTNDGFTPGFYLAGAQFIDADFIKGKNQCIFGYIYGVRSKKHYYNFSYQTPIVFKRGCRSRIFLKGSNGGGEIKYQAGFTNDFGMPLTPEPKINMKTYFSYNNLKTFISVDSIDWTIADYYLIQNQFSYNTGHWLLGLNFCWTDNFFNTDWSFSRLTFEIEKNSRLYLTPLYFRIFAGKVLGTAPNQERIFLSGGLRHTFISDLFFGHKGYASPQEHIHIKQDGNMAGYQGYHIKTDGIISLNLQLPEGFPLRIFGDLGYYYNRDSLKWEYAYDTGIKIVVGPVGVILPLYNHIDKLWPKNWSVEFVVPGISF
ncbi:MAG: M1 family metallopeptidase [candidate division WOR-3 bacterium]|nr:M1 family metallopeptidase [candidate division WOR-3 bacterium]